MDPAEAIAVRARPTPCRPLGVILTTVLLSLFIAACGITLSIENSGSEIFKELTIEGELTAGEELALSLAYEQPYPVEILVVCDLLDPLAEDEDAEELARILSQSVAPNSAGGPPDEATPEPGTIQQTFAAPASPGLYLVRCRTEADEDNAIFEEIKIVARRTPEP